MDWRSPRRGEGATVSRYEAFEGHGRVRSARARERSIDGAKGLRPRRGCGDPCCPPAVPKATPAKALTGGKEPAASAVTTDTARRILQTLDRLAGQKPGSDADAVIASPAAKPLNLSSSLNKAAAPTSSPSRVPRNSAGHPGKIAGLSGETIPRLVHRFSLQAHRERTETSPLQFQPEAFKEQGETVNCCSCAQQ